MTSERERFEAAMAAKGYHTPPSLYRDGTYRDTCYSAGWDAWQARAALPAPADQPPEPLGSSGSLSESSVEAGLQDAASAFGGWVPMHERAPALGTECLVLLRYSLDRPAFASVDRWDVQREDPTGMGGPTIETGEGWNDNHESDVIAWIAIPPHPPADWDQRLGYSEQSADAAVVSAQHGASDNSEQDQPKV